MELGIKGKTAVVSGASRGIGFAVASTLAAEGCNVFMTARGEETLSVAAEEVAALGAGPVGWLAADMTTEEGVDEVVSACRERFGSAAIAVPNVAGPKSEHFDTIGDEAYLDAYRAMVLSVVWLARRVLPDMRANGWGRIVNIGSDCVREVHRELPLVLANVTRAASLGLLKTLSDEVAGEGITVNNIATGGILTENRITYHERYAAEHGLDVSEIENAGAGHIPVQRFGDPAELAAVVAFLCSDQAAFVTGETIGVNGGRNRRLL